MRLSRSNAAAVQGNARKVLPKLLESLGGFALDCGISVGELNLMLREGAVRTAARRQYDSEGRVNISGIAAMTGISRAEVARILANRAVSLDKRKESSVNPTTKVLNAWHIDPRFLSASGQPAELRLFGRGLTFESLVNQHGRGIPVRAIFDELIRLGAIEVTDSHRIHPLMSVAVDRRITSQMIKDLGSGATDLFSVVSQATGASREKRQKKLTKRRKNFSRVC